ncbi:hypothetical protein pb186bvf_019507 [Paramecium bursaria]
MNRNFEQSYTIGKYIGQGSFGEVYEGSQVIQNSKQEIPSNNRIAIKLEPESVKPRQLDFEYSIYQDISPERGIPVVHDYFFKQSYAIMVMELLGKSIHQLFQQQNRNFSLKTVLMIAEQMIDRLEYIHSKSIVHRDIQPGNLAIGVSEKQQIIYLIDFGLSKRINVINGIQIFKNMEQKFLGTNRFASINTHKQIESSRKDDLESLAYTLIYLIKGQLPWQNNYNNEQVINMKQNPSLYCWGIPQEFLNFINYAQNLLPQQQPDYESCRQNFRTLFFSLNFEYDWVFDWQN